MIVRSWVATVAPGRLDDALEWVRRDLVPRALMTPGCVAAEILKSTGDPARVVCLTRWDEPPRFEEGWIGDVLVSARTSQYETV